MGNKTSSRSSETSRLQIIQHSRYLVNPTFRDPNQNPDPHLGFERINRMLDGFHSGGHVSESIHGNTMRSRTVISFNPYVEVNEYYEDKENDSESGSESGDDSYIDPNMDHKEEKRRRGDC